MAARGDVVHPSYSKVKDNPKVKKALEYYKSVYAKGGSILKEAETELNAAIEEASSGVRKDASALGASFRDVLAEYFIFKKQMGHQKALDEIERRHGRQTRNEVSKALTEPFDLEKLARLKTNRGDQGMTFEELAVQVGKVAQDVSALEKRMGARGDALTDRDIVDYEERMRRLKK